MADDTNLYEQYARIGKALASARRVELLDLLCQGERSVEALARTSGMTVTNTSQHLRVLRAARLADARKAGAKVIYSLGDEDVCRFFFALRGWPGLASPRSSSSRGATSSVAGRPSLSAARSCSRTRGAAPSSCSTCARTTSTCQDTFRTRSRLRSRSSSGGSHRCPAAPRSSPAGAACTACSHHERSSCCAGTASARAGSRTAFRSGARRLSGRRRRGQAPGRHDQGIPWSVLIKRRF